MSNCDRCGRVVELGDWPFCPHGRAASAVIGDEIDMVVENNGTPDPIRFRSREAMKKHLDAYHLSPMVRHVPLPGTDKSPYTSDWSRGIDPQTLENARVLLSRQGAGAQPLEHAPLPIDVTVRTLDTGFVVRMEE
jgi:hypothetical protein